MKKSLFEVLIRNRLVYHAREFGMPKEEYVFHPKRKWRFDFAYPEQKIAVECEGGIWIKGAHVRGKHFISDCQKYNAAQLMGWKVLRYTPNNSEELINDLKTAMRGGVDAKEVLPRRPRPK